eukprot:2288511-Pyramimonas_sp.AAC.1
MSQSGGSDGGSSMKTRPPSPPGRSCGAAWRAALGRLATSLPGSTASSSLRPTSAPSSGRATRGSTPRSGRRWSASG